MNAEELKAVLVQHSKWLNNEEGGERADLRWANLSGADLSGADLRRADLSEADLGGANLRGADLREANLARANLVRADLRWANLGEADLARANLRGADIDFSCWPLWCGSKSVKVDAQIARQLAAHFCVLECDNAEYQAARAAILEFAKGSHRASDLGLVNGDTEK